MEYDVPGGVPPAPDRLELKRKPWSVLLPSFRAERKRFEAEVDTSWDRAQSEAGPPRAAIPTGFDHLRQLGRPRHEDPTVDAAIARLHELLHELPLTQYGLGVDERGVIQVKIRPFRTRQVRRIKETCGAASVEIARVARN